MSYCGNCGAECAESANFCTNCGTPVQRAQQAAATDAGSQEPATQPAGAPASNQPSATAEPAVNPYTGKKTSEGLLRLAVNDVKTAVGMKQLVLLTLMSCVPILSFVPTGYALKWGRLAAFRTGDPLPEDLFGNKAFVTGFYAFVISLVFGLVAALVAAVPLVGWLVSLAVYPPLYLCLMLMATMDDLSAGFRISDMWEKLKQDVGGLLVIVFVPLLAVLGIALLATFVLCLVWGVLAFVPADPLFYDASRLAMPAVILALTLTLAVSFGLMFVAFKATLISFRALGYWIGRFAPDWVQEAVRTGKSPF